MTNINPPASTNYTSNTQYINLGVNGNTGVTPSPPAEGPGGGSNVDRGSLSGPTAAGAMAYTDPTISGTDWGALTDAVYAANLSVTVTAILVLMIEIMSQARQDSREDALQMAQLALDQGLAAAEDQKDAAVLTLVASIITNATTIVTSAMSAASAGSQLKTISAAKTTALADAETNFPMPKDATPEQTKAVDLQRSQAVKADMAALTSELSIETAYMQGVTGAGGAVGKMAAAMFEYAAAVQQAEAQAHKATGEYLQSMAQSELEFFRQLGDAMKNYLSGMESVDQAQHKATGAIYNC